VSVRINDGRNDRIVTARASRLRWKRTAPGGFHSLSASLNLDPSTFDDLGPADRIWVYGPRGQTLWEGFLDNPGEESGDGGLGLDISATGTTVLASDRAQALVYRDTDLSRWSQGVAPTAGTAVAPSASAGTANDPSAPDDGSAVEGLLLQFNPNQPLAQQASARMKYDALVGSGMVVGAITFRIKSGVTDANYRNDLGYAVDTGAYGNIPAVNGATISTTPSGPHVYAGGDGTLPVSQTRVTLQLRRAAVAGSVGAIDTLWSFFYEIAVLGHRYNLAGVLVAPGTMSATPGFVRADQVATDLVIRCMPNIIDTAASTIETTTYQIDQLAYPDPVTAADVLDDLAVYEPDFLWEMLHSTGAGYVFNYRAWPTTVRYEVSNREGYDAPGAEYDLCNRVAVYWTDVKGRPRTTIVTATSATYPALAALEVVGRVRDAEAITLPQGRGSAANALRAGQQVLAMKADPPKAATVTVRQPVADLLRGGRVMPYEIEPGYLVRVRETGDVLRLTEVEVDDEAGVAVLTLGEPILSEEQQLAQLKTTARRQR
jgi:hypothetical protein